MISKKIDTIKLSINLPVYFWGKGIYLLNKQLFWLTFCVKYRVRTYNIM